MIVAGLAALVAVAGATAQPREVAVADGIVVFNRDFAISGFTVTGVRIAPRAFRSMHVVSTSPVLFRDKSVMSDRPSQTP